MRLQSFRKNDHSAFLFLLILGIFHLPRFYCQFSVRFSSKSIPFVLHFHTAKDYNREIYSPYQLLLFGIVSEINSCSLCLKTSMPYVHPWYAKCDTSPGLVVISVFNCQGAAPLSSVHIITQKTELSRISTNPEKHKKKAPISAISETGTFSYKLFIFYHLC